MAYLFKYKRVLYVSLICVLKSIYKAEKLFVHLLRDTVNLTMKARINRGL